MKTESNAMRPLGFGYDVLVKKRIGRTLCLVIPLLVAMQLGTAHGQIVNQWTNLNAGNLAGDWFGTSNWNLGTVPGASTAAQVGNGGEANATSATATGPINVTLIEVGTNGGGGTLTVDAVDMSLATSLDVGVVDGLAADGAVTVTADGEVTISDATNIQFGTSGLGDINVAQTTAFNGANALGTGRLVIERATTVRMTGILMSARPPERAPPRATVLPLCETYQGRWPWQPTLMSAKHRVRSAAKTMAPAW